MPSLEQWIAEQHPRAVAGMLMSVSPVDVIKQRPGFGQVVQPRRGAIVASPCLAAYDPDPDYFFHWFRDGAVVIDALRLLHKAGTLGRAALEHLGDFVDFSLSLAALDGAALVAAPGWRARVAPQMAQHVRDDAELAAVRGDGVAAEARVNPDGTIDILRWSRPQHDGPPLRALMLLRWLPGTALDDALRARVDELVRADLAFTEAYWHTPSFDIWEEERGHHYYTLRLAAAALEEGGAWLAAQGEGDTAARLQAQGRTVLATLDGYWLEAQGYYRSRAPGADGASTKDLDIAVIFAAIHAAGGGAHGVADPRQHATLARLEALFDAAYPINHGRPASRGPAMGRYSGDAYYSGGAYYFSTLAAAEFCFRAARQCAGAPAWFARGDAFLETVRAYTPANGDMSEQFDQRSGLPTSARHLAWSYAAFISCIAARRAAAAAR